MEATLAESALRARAGVPATGAQRLLDALVAPGAEGDVPSNGRPGVVLVTSGPGVSNTITGPLDPETTWSVP